MVVKPGQNPWAFQDPVKKEYELEPERWPSLPCLLESSAVCSHQTANALFVAYDADGSGYIDLKEFTALCKSYDPRIEPGEIAQVRLVGCVAI